MRSAPRCTVATLLNEARIAGVERLEATTLIGHGLGRTRTWLIGHDDAEVNEVGAAFCRDLLNRRVLGEPVAYLVEEKEFHGLRFRVSPAVLIPRPDTEALVDWALELLGGALGSIEAPRVLDLGTGSGAIALAVKHACPHAEVLAVDISEAALDIARSNASELGLGVRFARSDWWSAIDDDVFDLVLSNPPYVAEGDSHLAALAFEPAGALVAGADGLRELRRIVLEAPRHLRPDGWLLMEHGFDQGAAVRGMLASTPWANLATRRDLAGRERCSGAMNVPKSS